MKKIFLAFLCFILSFCVLSEYFGTSSAASLGTTQRTEEVQRDIAKKIIRFHVLANSDSDKDQELKIKVKDKVIGYMAPKLQNCKNINEARKILIKNDGKIKEIADKIIRENNYNYGVRTELAKVEFPVKKYGDVVLPEGKYEAYRVLIGKAEGHNWWCVMFPPLCFTDITKGEVEEDKTLDEMKSVLTKNEFDTVNNSKKNNDIKVKFKILEEIKAIAKKISADIN